MPRQSTEQKKIVAQVMHEYKEGDLESGSGDKVGSRKQAVAIALSEAGASREESPAGNRKNLRRTRAKKGGDDSFRDDGPTRDQLYREAQKRDIPGRSKMSKAQLSRALRQ